MTVQRRLLLESDFVNYYELELAGIQINKKLLDHHRYPGCYRYVYYHVTPLLIVKIAEAVVYSSLLLSLIIFDSKYIDSIKLFIDEYHVSPYTYSFNFSYYGESRCKQFYIDNIFPYTYSHREDKYSYYCECIFKFNKCIVYKGNCKLGILSKKDYKKELEISNELLGNKDRFTKTKSARNFVC